MGKPTHVDRIGEILDDVLGQLPASRLAYLDQYVAATRDNFKKKYGVDLDDPAERRAVLVTAVELAVALRTLAGDIDTTNPPLANMFRTFVWAVYSIERNQAIGQ